MDHIMYHYTYSLIYILCLLLLKNYVKKVLTWFLRCFWECVQRIAGDLRPRNRLNKGQKRRLPSKHSSIWDVLWWHFGFRHFISTRVFVHPLWRCYHTVVCVHARVSDFDQRVSVDLEADETGLFFKLGHPLTHPLTYPLSLFSVLSSLVSLVV